MLKKLAKVFRETKAFSENHPDRVAEFGQKEHDEAIRQTSVLRARVAEKMELGESVAERGWRRGSEDDYDAITASGKLVHKEQREEELEIISGEVLSFGTEIDRLSDSVSSTMKMTGGSKRDEVSRLQNRILELVQRMTERVGRGLNRLEHKEMTLYFSRIREIAGKLDAM